MADYAEADARLMEWLGERTDTQLQNIVDAEGGLTNCRHIIREDEDGTRRGCLVGWALDCRGDRAFAWTKLPMEVRVPATEILCQYGLHGFGGLGQTVDDGRIMRRIQGFAAAELLTRRVERPRLPPAREVCSVDPLNTGYSEGA